jgi:hypothetical protein
MITSFLLASRQNSVCISHDRNMMETYNKNTGNIFFKICEEIEIAEKLCTKGRTLLAISEVVFRN